MKRAGRQKAAKPTKRSKSGAARTPRKAVAADANHCHNCGEDLKKEDKALFVEEEVGRVFCSEPCIADYFTPEIERLEKEYFRHLSKSDLSAEDREALAHLRWITLQEPDESWREKTLQGDHRYTLISEFNPGNEGQKRIWCVCICLFLRNEPSFLYLAFVTRNAGMVDAYRRGEPFEWHRTPGSATGASAAEGHAASGSDVRTEEGGEARVDGLAESWSEEETQRAEILSKRKSSDIPQSEFNLYQGCLEETLEAPNEVWSQESGAGLERSKVYHFIRFYPDEGAGVWYVVVAKEPTAGSEAAESDQIELVDAFPTKDSDLVDSLRRGHQEAGEPTAAAANVRVVH